jgi:transcriptional regulator with XRE-family HTH domain
MIDYASIGQKVREKRLKRGITQEQLAEAVGVGVTHISHLETGHGTVSLKVFLAITNYLNCSADEILCKEVYAARPLVDHWLAELVSDCNSMEIKIIADAVTGLKETLRKNVAFHEK